MGRHPWCTLARCARALCACIQGQTIGQSSRPAALMTQADATGCLQCVYPCGCIACPADSLQPMLVLPLIVVQTELTMQPKLVLCRQVLHSQSLCAYSWTFLSVAVAGGQALWPDHDDRGGHLNLQQDESLLCARFRAGSACCHGVGCVSSEDQCLRLVDVECVMI